MPSATEPVSQAFERTKKTLFRPFDLGKWFVMGFTAFLAGLGERGGGGNFQVPSGNSGGRGGGGGGLSDAAEFVREHIVIIAIIGSVVLLLAIGIGALISWLNSRGKFMFMDNVVNDRAAVKAPWREWAPEANNFFVFRFVAQLIFGLVSLAVLVAAAVLAWPSITANSFDSMAIVALLAVVGYFLIFGICFAVFLAVLQDFAVPIMFLRRVRVTEALAVFRSEILPGNLLTIVLYYLIKIGLGFAAGILAILVTCLTCCMTAIPYIGTVILLPIMVFFESYKLHFIEQFGPQWRIFPDEPVALDAGPDRSWGSPEGESEGSWGSIPR